MPKADVVIVGAGIAGLTCAVELVASGVTPLLIEASDRVGGRIRSDVVDGFVLDRGFQVLLTAYPEAKRLLDYDALKLGRFRSGALVRSGGKFHKIADPMRHLLDALPGAFAPVGTIADKLRVAELRARVSSGSLDDLLARPETSTLEALQQAGFSAGMIQDFFRPFFGGIYLESDLITSSRKFDFVFRMFAEGEAALPASGMQAIPKQLAGRLPARCIRLGTTAAEIGPERVITRFGEAIEADHIVVATEETAAARLLPRYVTAPATWTAAVCLYYDAPASPVDGPWLVLNGESGGPINNLCVPTEVCREYGPDNGALVSVTVVGNPPMMDAQIEAHVRAQLVQWYGRDAAGWKHLRTYRIEYAQPLQAAGALDPVSKPVELARGLYRCGDSLDIASTQGAMASGRRAAEAILRRG